MMCYFTSCLVGSMVSSRWFRGGGLGSSDGTIIKGNENFANSGSRGSSYVDNGSRKAAEPSGLGATLPFESFGLLRWPPPVRSMFLRAESALASVADYVDGTFLVMALCMPFCLYYVVSLLLARVTHKVCRRQPHFAWTCWMMSSSLLGETLTVSLDFCDFLTLLLLDSGFVV